MAIGLIGCEDLRGEVPLRNDSPILRGEDLERVNKRPNGIEKHCRIEIAFGGRVEIARIGFVDLSWKLSCLDSRLED